MRIRSVIIIGLALLVLVSMASAATVYVKAAQGSSVVITASGVYKEGKVKGNACGKTGLAKITGVPLNKKLKIYAYRPLNTNCPYFSTQGCKFATHYAGTIYKTLRSSGSTVSVPQRCMLWNIPF